jgi:adenosylhomocysteine nucleosidase
LLNPDWIKERDMAWGIMSAVEEEVWLIIDNMSQVRESRWSERVLYQGRIKDRDVVVMPTGVGKAKTAASVQFLLDHFPVEAIIFTGVAGAINPDLKIGDIVIGQKTVQHDFDAGGKGILEDMRTPWFEADPRLVELALRASQDLGLGDRVRVGVVLTGDQTVIDSQKKEWLWQAFQGDCVEMEGAAVALACSLNKVPFVLIRAITDLADENARGDFRRTMPQIAVDSATIALGMLGEFDGARVLKRNFFFRVRRFLSRRTKTLIGC